MATSFTHHITKCHYDIWRDGYVSFKKLSDSHSITKPINNDVTIVSHSQFAEIQAAFSIL